MYHYLRKIFFYVFLLITESCIDPYTPNLENYKSNLVVEGLITNENCSYKIKLSRTINKEDAVPENISDATLYLTDGEDKEIYFKNCGNGYYKSDSTQFQGSIGQKYILHINTSDGNKYISDECVLESVPDIETVYYEKNEELQGSPAKYYTGLRIMLNSSEFKSMNQYLRWTFEEVWKINIPLPQVYTYHLINDTTFNFQSVFAKQTCWKKSISADIITNSTELIKSQEIKFIAPELSDRLTRQYSINVKQYSLSQQEYSFWNNLKKVGEPNRDIFSPLPYSVPSNIHNINDNNEIVLGYFSVSAVTQKRLFITSKELYTLGLPNYKNDCVEIKKSPSDYFPSIVTWDEIYHHMVDLQHYVFTRPEVKDGVVLPGVVVKRQLLKFVFTTKICSSCDESGFSTQPDFWIDL